MSSLLWVILIGAIILPKANRNPRALLIILPLLIINILWLGFAKLLNFPSYIKMQFDMLFNAFTIGIAMLWLLAHKLGNRNRFMTFLLASIIMIFISILGQIAHGEFSEQTIIFLFFIIFLSLALLISFVLAGWKCRKIYSRLRFLLWLVAWTILSSLVVIMILMVVAMIISRPPTEMLKSILLQMLILSIVSGFLLYVIILPFMILAFYSPFFRERFYGCLRLKSMPITAPQSNLNISDEMQSPGQNNPKDNSPSSSETST